MTQPSRCDCHWSWSPTRTVATWLETQAWIRVAVSEANLPVSRSAGDSGPESDINQGKFRVKLPAFVSDLGSASVIAVRHPRWHWTRSLWPEGLLVLQVDRKLIRVCCHIWNLCTLWYHIRFNFKFIVHIFWCHMWYHIMMTVISQYYIIVLWYHSFYDIMSHSFYDITYTMISLFLLSWYHGQMILWYQWYSRSQSVPLYCSDNVVC
jgi:hypothetical protein